MQLPKIAQCCENYLLKLAFRFTSIYLAAWILVLLLAPNLSSHFLYGTDLTPVTHRMMISNIILRSTLVVLCWYLPNYTTPRGGRLFAYYAGLFWLLTSIFSITSILFDIHTGLDIVIIGRSIIEASLGIFLLVVSRHESKAALSKTQ